MENFELYIYIQTHIDEQNILDIFNIYKNNKHFINIKFKLLQYIHNEILALLGFSKSMYNKKLSKTLMVAQTISQREFSFTLADMLPGDCVPNSPTCYQRFVKLLSRQSLLIRVFYSNQVTFHFFLTPFFYSNDEVLMIKSIWGTRFKAQRLLVWTMLLQQVERYYIVMLLWVY